MNDVFNIINTIIHQELPNYNFEIFVGYQPTVQGLPTSNYLYLFPLGQKACSRNLVSYTYNETNHNYDCVASILYEGGYQLSGRVAKTQTYTVLDMFYDVYNTLKRPDIIQEFFAIGLGIYGYSNIRNLFFQNERGIYTQECSFDLEFSYTKTVLFKTELINAAQITLKDL